MALNRNLTRVPMGEADILDLDVVQRKVETVRQGLPAGAQDSGIPGFAPAAKGGAAATEEPHRRQRKRLGFDD